MEGKILRQLAFELPSGTALDVFERVIMTYAQPPWMTLQVWRLRMRRPHACAAGTPSPPALAPRGVARTAAAHSTRLATTACPPPPRAATATALPTSLARLEAPLLS
eukprot:5756648-Prymnesium_polylepis.1